MMDKNQKWMGLHLVRLHVKKSFHHEDSNSSSQDYFMESMFSYPTVNTHISIPQGLSSLKGYHVHNLS